jgi:hypothetical protein
MNYAPIFTQTPLMACRKQETAMHTISFDHLINVTLLHEIEKSD